MPKPAALLALASLVLAGVGGFAINQLRAELQLRDKVVALTGGDPDAGRAAIRRRGCGGCHEIPGVPGARSHVGPALSHFASRVYIGGRLTNTPANLQLWIRDPHRVDPLSAMVPTGATAPEARNIAAYLYTLR